MLLRAPLGANKNSRPHPPGSHGRRKLWLPKDDKKITTALTNEGNNRPPGELAGQDCKARCSRRGTARRLILTRGFVEKLQPGVTPQTSCYALHTVLKIPQSEALRIRSGPPRDVSPGASSVRPSV